MSQKTTNFRQIGTVGNSSSRYSFLLILNLFTIACLFAFFFTFDKGYMVGFGVGLGSLAIIAHIPVIAISTSEGRE